MKSTKSTASRLRHAVAGLLAVLFATCVAGAAFAQANPTPQSVPRSGAGLGINSTAVTHTLTVVTVGSGTVAKSPDQTDYDEGSLVTLTATAAAGFHFDVWSGDASGHTSPFTVTMDADKTITATFLSDSYSWNQTGTADFGTSTNWTPTRWAAANDDVLQFSNGATTTVTGVPNQTIAQLLITGNTNATLQPAVGSSGHLVLGGLTSTRP